MHIVIVKISYIFNKTVLAYNLVQNLSFLNSKYNFKRKYKLDSANL